MTFAPLLADNEMVKFNPRSTTTSAVGVLTLATLMSMAALGNPAGLSAVVMAGNYPGSQQGLRPSGDEDVQGWMSCLTQAAKSLRGGPRLPDHLSDAVMLPSLHTNVQERHLLAGTLVHHQDRVSLACPTLQSHLLNLPPPAMV